MLHEVAAIQESQMVMLKSKACPDPSGKHLAGFVSAFLEPSIILSITPVRLFTSLRYVQIDKLHTITFKTAS